jgi:hypothetical protein
MIILAHIATLIIITLCPRGSSDDAMIDHKIASHQLIHLVGSVNINNNKSGWWVHRAMPLAVAR